jgi:hypothetical protein
VGVGEFLSTLHPDFKSDHKGVKWKANHSLTSLDLRSNLCSPAKMSEVAALVKKNRDEVHARTADLEEALLAEAFAKTKELEPVDFVRFMKSKLAPVAAAKGLKADEAAELRERILLDLYSAIDWSQKCAALTSLTKPVAAFRPTRCMHACMRTSARHVLLGNSRLSFAV